MAAGDSVGAGPYLALCVECIRNLNMRKNLASLGDPPCAKEEP